MFSFCTFGNVMLRSSLNDILITVADEAGCMTVQPIKVDRETEVLGFYRCNLNYLKC